jgi:hypothetical protein
MLEFPARRLVAEEERKIMEIKACKRDTVGMLLALTCLALSAHVSFASDDTTPASTPPSEDNWITVDSKTTASGQKTVNTDGSVSKDSTSTTTTTASNQTTSKTVTSTTNASGTIQRSSSGSTWTGNSTTTNSNGGSTQTQTNGSSTNNHDGTGNWQSTTTGEHTNANGKETDWTANRDGSWQKTANGGTWKSESERTNSNGGSTERQTTGSWTNNHNGSGSSESTTTGEHTNANGKETTWTTDREGSWQKNADGSKSFERTADTKFSNGAEIDRQTNGTVTKTGNGYDVNSTTTGEAKNAKGKETDWTTTRSEQVVNNGNGTRSVNEEVTKTFSNGKTETIDRTGELVKEGNGKWQYEGSSTKTVTQGSTSTAKESTGTKPAVGARGEATTSEHQAFRKRFDEFHNRLENFRKSGGSPGERSQLRDHFQGLKKDWEEKHQRLADHELRDKFERAGKFFEEGDRGERGERHRRK